MRFLDTNVLLRHLVNDHPEQSQHATNLLLEIEAGTEHVFTTHMVLGEVVFTLSRYYKLSLHDIRDRVVPLIQLPALHLDLEHKGWFSDALDLAIEKNIGFLDAYNAVVMAERGAVEIYSWDRDFDRIDGITRIEPGTAPSGDSELSGNR